MHQHENTNQTPSNCSLRVAKHDSAKAQFRKGGGGKRKSIGNLSQLSRRARRPLTHERKSKTCRGGGKHYKIHLSRVAHANATGRAALRNTKEKKMRHAENKEDRSLTQVPPTEISISRSFQGHERNNPGGPWRYSKRAAFATVRRRRQNGKGKASDRVAVLKCSTWWADGRRRGPSSPHSIYCFFKHIFFFCAE